MATVSIDAGHGGMDSGAVYGDREEKDDVLRLAMAVGAILEHNGVNVSYVRTDDTYETPFKKAQDANASGADLFISIHRNSGVTPNTYSGIQSLVYKDSGIRKELAEAINQNLEMLGFKNLGIEERPNLVVLKRTGMPAVLLEVGFINNDEDNRIFDTRFNEIAQAIADGIMETLQKENLLSMQSVAAMPQQCDSGECRNMTDDNAVMGIDRNISGNTARNMNGNMSGRNAEDTDMAQQEWGRNDGGMSGGMNNESTSEGMNDRRMSDGMNNRNMSGGMNNADMSGNMTSDVNMTDERCKCPCEEKLYRVQVGAYRNKESADKILNTLLIEEFPAFIIYEDNLYKIQVGAFEFLANAVAMEERLRKYRYNTYITT